MKVLFDNGIPDAAAEVLTGHEVVLARKLGWAQVKNGDLIRLAEDAGFDLLLTTDKNIRYQQNLSQRTIALLVLGNGQWPALKLHLSLVVSAVEACQPGTYFELPIPPAPIAGI